MKNLIAASLVCLSLFLYATRRYDGIDTNSQDTINATKSIAEETNIIPIVTNSIKT